jgi:transglutaminase-like putative cysteine protease
MRLLAGCEMNLTVDAPTPLIAMLRPRSGLGQWVVSEAYKIAPFVPVVEYVDVFGNLCQRLVAPEGSFSIRVEAEVEAAPEIATEPTAGFTPIQDLPAEVLQYLLPSRYCPADRLENRAKEIVGRTAPGYAQVETIRAWIHSHIEYRYGVSDPSSGALETLQAGAGVCRDFTHVGLSLCRSLRIPARMVVGYLHRLDPMDMHAWFEAFVGGRWYTFDATQTSPRGGRITVAYGRDAADVALFNEYGPVKMKKMNVWVNDAGSERRTSS